jgi:hypothetical protein
MTLNRVTPENITELAGNEVFVFGSNLLGIHGGGAARTAREKFGAEMGVGEGLTGQCYAFPTVTGPTGSLTTRQLSRESLELARDKLFQTAREMPEVTFFLTKVGCGLAGYPKEYMASLFRDSPPNVVKPAGW